MPAPIVEIIAELRWDHGVPALGTAQPAAFPGVIFGGPASAGLEEFFMRFGAAAARLDHRNIERLVPPGLPLVPYQSVYRFRSDQSQSPPASIYQVGPGLFTANAIPPYESWKTFQPVVTQGIEALISSRPFASANASFTGVALRYIDVFDEVFSQGRNAQAFLSDILGIRIDLPEVLAEKVTTGMPCKPVVQLGIPAPDGSTFGLVFGEGDAGGRHGYVMESSISSMQPVAATADAVMQVFNGFYQTLHDSFVRLTKPLHPLLPPEARQ